VAHEIVTISNSKTLTDVKIVHLMIVIYRDKLEISKDFL